MGQPEHAAPKAQGTRSNRRIHRFMVVFMSAYLAWNVWDIFSPTDTGHESPVPTPNHDNELFTDWDLITASEELNWFPCFRSVDQYFCTRLTVPMDYNRPLNASPSNPKVHIALLMLPGNHANSGLRSESPLLVNPGGPGGSGTGLVLRAGRAMQTVVGADRDIIGFDPRGIGASTPRADCFAREGAEDEGSLMRRLLWQMGTMAGGLPNTSSIATEQVVLRARGVTTLCGTQDGEDSILRYAGTPNVAQDMLSIVQAWDRWTDKMDGHDFLDDEVVEVGEPADGPSSLSTRGKLVYWGFSYGTILGATFATIFPDKVGRMVLDGVANSDEWYFDNYWINAVEDTDKVVDKFQLYCYLAKEHCQLYRKGDKLEDVKARYESVLSSLAEKPRVYAIKGKTPFVVTYSDVKYLLFATTYQPITTLVIVAVVLDALYRDVDMGSITPPFDFVPLCGMKPSQLSYPSEGQIAVLCSDQRGLVVNESRDGLDELLTKMTDVGSFGPVAFTIAVMCAGWDIKPIDPPSMNWDSLPLTEKGPVNTSYPLVFVSNTRDPVTPLSSGLRQVQKFVDAGFIEQISEGHCSISSISTCTLKKIQGYFSKGVVPDKPVFDSPEDGSLAGKWTTCEIDRRPYDVLPEVGKVYSAEEVELVQAGLDVQKEMKAWHLGFPAIPHHAFEHLLRMDEDEVARLFGST